MKKTLILLALFISSITIAQTQVESFNLTIDGYDNQYRVFEYDDKSEAEIFQSLKKWFEYNVRNAEYANYSEVENEYLTYVFIDAQTVKGGRGLTQYNYTVFYDVELRIKDNRFRLDLFIKKIPLTSNQNGGSLNLKGGLFKKNGALRKNNVAKSVFSKLELSANNLAKSLGVSVSGDVDYKKKDW